MLVQRERDSILQSTADGGTARKSNYYVGGDAVQPMLQPKHNIESIQKIIKSLSKQQLIDILIELKKFIHTNPEGGKQMLIDNPALAQAVLQIQLLFGLVKSDDCVHIQPNIQHTQPTQFYNNMPLQPPSMPVQQQSLPIQQSGIDMLLAKLPPAEQKVLREVLKLSPEQIRMLPAHVQQQVQLITSQLQKR